MFNEFENMIIESEKNRLLGLRKLADSYFEGKNGMQENKEKAFAISCLAALEGDAVSSARAGQCLLEGIGTEKNLNESFMYFLHAAKKNHRYAQYKVGLFYKDENVSDIIVPYNPVTGNEWMQKAADNGVPEAMHNLGCAYIQGNGVIYDLDKAFYWFQKGAEKGYLYSMQSLILFYDGQHGYKYADDNLTGYWLNEAAKMGDPESQKFLKKNFKYSSFSQKWKRIY